VNKLLPSWTIYFHRHFFWLAADYFYFYWHDYPSTDSEYRAKSVARPLYIFVILMFLSHAAALAFRLGILANCSKVLVLVNNNFQENFRLFQQAG